MKKGLLVFVLSCLAIGSQAQSKKKPRKRSKSPVPVKQVNKEPSVALQNALLLCASRDSLPAWHLHNPADFKFPQNFPVPAKYQVYGTIYPWLKKSLSAIPFGPESKTFTLPAPLAGGVDCITYKLHRVLTMDSALQAKYPELMSFSGAQIGNALNDIRIDCDEHNIKIMIRHAGETYFINSVPYRETFLFAAFNKNDAGYLKKPFETKK